MIKNNKEEEKEQIIKTSLVIKKKGAQPYIYEQIYDKERNRTEYIGFPLNSKINYNSYFKEDKEAGFVKCYEIYSDKEKSEFLGITQHVEQVYNDDGTKCMPIDDEEIKKNVIILPSELKFFDSESKLDEKIKSFINKWLDIDDNYTYIAVQNIKSFWLYDKFETINYLRALGDTGTGKSRFLHTFGFLSYKPLFCSGATTVSPIFRLITKWQGTVIIDEADLKNTDESTDFIKLLNQGYEKNASILRCNPLDKSKIDFFNPFCPKIIATRKTFDDKAVESRCMTTLMKQTARRDIPFNLNQSFYDDALELRNMLLFYRFVNYNKIDVNFSETLEIKERMKKYEPRLQQVNNILLCLFSNNNLELDSFFNYMDKKQSDIIKERADSFDGWIIEALSYLIMEKGIDIDGYIKITSKDVDLKLKELENRDKDYNPRLIGKHLKTLGFEMKQKKISGKNERILFFKESNIILFERYLEDNELLLQIVDKINRIIKKSNMSNMSNMSIGARSVPQETGVSLITPPYTDTHVTNVTHVTFDFEENLYKKTKTMEIIEIIKQNPKDNAQLLENQFGEKLINDMSKLGYIYENPKGTWNIL